MSGEERATVEAAFRAEGLVPHTWSKQPRHVFGAHEHGYHKVLFCIEGSVTFHTPDGEVHLEPGDRLDLLPGTPHSATVGRHGVTCMEAARR